MNVVGLQIQWLIWFLQLGKGQQIHLNDNRVDPYTDEDSLISRKVHENEWVLS